MATSRCLLALICIATLGSAQQPGLPTDKTLDCAVRTAAWNYSQSLQPYGGVQAAVFDAFQLAAYCGLAPPLDVLLPPQPLISLPTPGFIIDAVHGNDDCGNGTEAAPFQTIQRGINACRGIAPFAAGCAVVLRDSGPFYITSTITLFANDSGLALQAYPGESPAVVGGVPLTNAVWQPYNTSGGANIWRSSLQGVLPTGVPGSLFVNGARAVRARFPNANPETDIIPTGYTGAASWLPPKQYPAPIPILNTSLSRAFDHYFPNWTWASGGTGTGQFEPAEGYWLAPNPPGGVPYQVPGGLIFDPSTFSPRVNSWKNASTGIIHAFHGEYWGNWMFQIASLDAVNRSIEFGLGGWQEARGSTSGAAIYVDNIFEELDSPNEWFFDEMTSMLYFWYNASSGTPPPSKDASLVASQLETLLHVSGTSAAPVNDITVTGITFTVSQPTFLTRPFKAPSGGDWSFSDFAAVIVEGSNGTTVESCSFSGLGGNAILVRDWNRDVVIANSSFQFIGESAIVTCGQSNLIDIAGEQVPAGTLIAGNIFSELGVYVKQAGALYSALSANHTVVRNIAFNLPRAAININDGAFGGHLIENNLFFNAVRETQDHGAINSWDREPYLQPEQNNSSSPSLLPSWSRLNANFIVNSYYGIHSLDHDDGSNSFLDTNNVIAFAGMKNYEGFGKITSGNLFVRPDFQAPLESSSPNSPEAFTAVPMPTFYYFPYCARSVGQWTWGRALADVYEGNTCILNSTSPYVFGECTPSAPSADGLVPLTANNTFYTLGGALQIHCASSVFSLAEAQAVGYDTGSKAFDGSQLQASAIVDMIHKWLQF